MSTNPPNQYKGVDIVLGLRFFNYIIGFQHSVSVCDDNNFVSFCCLEPRFDFDYYVVVVSCTFNISTEKKEKKK